MKLSTSFYDTSYKSTHFKKSPKGLWGVIYQYLRKYEHYRGDVAYALLKEGNTYCDIGCGDGSLVFKLRSKYKYLYGIDISDFRLKQAKKNLSLLNNSNQSKIKFLKIDIDDKITLPKNFFDSITMIATFEHFFDPYHVILEVNKILKTGGQLIIQVPNIAYLPRRFQLLIGKLPITSEDEYGWDGGHLHYFTVSELVNFLKKNGFQINQVTCSGLLKTYRKWWVSLLGADIIVSSTKI
jgi:SAM-dependent methyltransferase